MSQTYIPAALRRLVRERAEGRCEYCLIPEQATFAPHWIDHIVAEKHGGCTDADNLANSCILCNQRKGSDLSSIDPQNGEITPLFHPRHDRWTDHFRLSDGRIEPCTGPGRVTERLLQFKLPERIEERKGLLETGLLTLPAK